MSRTVSHWINGQVIAGTSGRQSDVFNPAIGEPVAKVDLASKAEIDKAVEIAHKAYLEWREVTPLRRARVMFKFKELVEANHRQLAEMITTEHGKTVSDAMGKWSAGSKSLNMPVAFHRC